MKINNTKISINSTYCTDIAKSDGDIERTKDLIWICKESGADCAKFQHFLGQIVSIMRLET